MEKTIKYLENGEYHYATVKDVGDLAKLKTDSKDDLVTAINELFITGGEASKKPDGYDELVDNVADAIQKQQQMTDTITNMQQSAQLSDAEMQHMKQVQEEAHQDYIKALKELNDAIAQANADALELDKKTDELKKNADDLNKKTNDLQDKLNETFTNVGNEVSAVHKQLDTESAGLHKELNDTKTSLEATRKDLLNNTQEFGVVNSEVKELKDKMDRRIWSTDLDPVREQVNKNTTEVSQTKDELKNKADQSNLDLVTNSVENLSTQVKENADGLKVSVKKDELGGDVAKLLNDKTNLLLGTRNFSGDSWGNKTFWHEEAGYWKGLKVFSSTEIWFGLQYKYEVKQGQQYTFSFWARQEKDNSSASIVLSEGNKGDQGIVTPFNQADVHIGTEWKRYSLTFQAESDGIIYPRVEQAVEGNKLYVAGYKLEVGNVATPWEPNEADVAENIEHNESQFNVYSDQIASIVKKQEKMGDTERQLDTRITETAEGLKQTSKDLQNANGKITEFQGQLESTAKGLKTDYEKYTNEAVGQISDSSLNLIHNSAFSNQDNQFESWQNISAKATVREDSNNLHWVELTQSGQGTDNPIGVTSNYFIVKQGKVTVAVDVKLGDKANLDNQNILLLELYDESKKRVDFTDVSVSQLGLSMSVLNDHNVHRGLYRLGIDRKDVKYMTVKAILHRNGDLWLTNFSARLSSIDDGGYMPNPDDVNHQILKMNTKIEEDAEHIALKANSVDVTRVVQESVGKVDSRLTNEIGNVNNQIDSKTKAVSDKVDNIRIGGRNLIKGTDKDFVVSLSDLHDPGSSANYIYWPVAQLIAGKTYTFSADMRGVNTNQMSWMIWDRSTGANLGGPQTLDIDGSRKSFTFTTDNSNHSWLLLLYGGPYQNSQANNKVIYHHAMLEYGNVATDWTPAPEDVDSKFQYKEITGAIDFNDLKTQQKIFYRDTKAKNSPAGSNYWYFVDVKPISDRIVQVATSDRNNITWMRTLADTWTPWQRQATQGDVDNVNGQINTANGKISTLQLATQWHTVSGPLDLNDLKTQQRIFYQDTQEKNSAVSGWQYITVDTADNSRITQTVWKDNVAMQYTRQYINSSWSQWTRNANQADIDKASNGLRQEIKSAKDAAIDVASDKIEIKANEIKTITDQNLNTRINEVKTASEKYTSDGIEQVVKKVSEVKNNVDGLENRLNDTQSAVNGVSQKLDNIQVGGRNLVPGTAVPYAMGYGIPATTWKDNSAYLELPTTVKRNEILPQEPRSMHYTLIKGTTYTQTVWFETDAKLLKENGLQFTWFTNDGHDGQPAVLVKLGENRYKAFSTYTWPGKNDNSLRLFDIFNFSDLFAINNSGTYLKFTHLKLEEGNQSTDWTPAPEDVDQQISDKVDTKTLESANIDDLRTQGHYFVKDLTGNPIGGWVYVDVIGNNNDRIRQDVYQDNGSKHMYRRLFGTAWSGWEQGAYLSDVNSLKTEVTASVKNLGDRVTTEVNSITSKVNSNNGGGVNLLLNTQSFDQNWTWDSIGHSFANGILTLSDTNNGNSRMYQGIAGKSPAGRTFTLSFNARISDDCNSEKVGVRVGPYDAGKSIDVTGKSFQSYKLEGWQWTGTSTTFSFYVIGGKIDISNLKLEYGYVATPWSQAPEDVNEAIKSVNTKLDVANGQIQGKVTETDVNNILNGKGYATQSWAQSNFRMKSDSISLEVKEITDPISSEVNNVNSKLDNLQVGGTNLLKGTSMNPIAGDAPATDWKDMDSIYNTIAPLSEDQYVLSFEARGDIDNQRILTFLYHGGLGGNNIVKSSVTSQGRKYSNNVDGSSEFYLTTQWARYWVIYNVSPENSRKQVIVGRRWANEASGKVYIRKVQLERGNVATDWSPAPEDTSAEISSAKDEAINVANDKIDNSHKELQGQISSAQGDISTLKQTASDFGSKVSGMETSLDNANSKINDITSNGGGRNLLQGTRDFSGSNWLNLGNIWTKTDETYNGLSVVETTDNWSGIAQYYQVKQGETYTFSLFARYTSGTGTSNFYIGLNANPENGHKIAQVDNWMLTCSLDTNWKKYSITFTATTDGYIKPRMERTNNNSNVLRVCGFMLEKGTVAHDWSPAPEDTSAEIKSAKDTAINVANGKIENSSKELQGQIDNSSKELQGKISSAKDEAENRAKELESQLNTTKNDLQDIKAITQWHTVSGPIDLNDLKTQTRIFYRDIQDKNSAVTGWQYIVVDSSSDKVTQTVWKDNSTIQYIRQFTGTWTNWVRQTNQNDIDEAKTGLREEIKSAKDAAINVAKDNIEIKVNELKTTYEETLNTKINEVKTASEKFTSDGIEQTVTKITEVQSNVDNLNEKVDSNNGGGINLQKGTKDFSFQIGTNGNPSSIETYNSDTKMLHTQNGGFYTSYSDSSFVPTPGEFYTFSADVKGDGTINGSGFRYEGGNNGTMGNITLSDTWQRIINTVHVDKVQGQWVIYPSNSKNLYVKHIKIERGTVATPWTPAPEDVQTQIDANKTAANNAQNTANTANSMAGNAVTNASSAVSVANNANTTANQAKSNASSAVSVANNANTTANQAKSNASSAVSVANNANNNANQANNTASSAVNTANQAKSNATQAVTTANSANSKINDIQANGGGRNLLQGTRDFKNFGYLSKVAVTNGQETFQAVTGTQSSSATYYDIVNFSNVPLEKDTDYTASFWIKTSENVDITSYLFDSGSNGNYSDSRKVNQSTTDYKRIVVHFHNGNNTATPSFIPARINKAGVTIWVYGCMLEKGTIAHDWSPAPEDVNQGIKDATEYKVVTGTLDFNDLKTKQKIFYRDVHAANTPAGTAYWYYLDVEPGYDGRILQTAVSDRDNITWVRTFADSWSPWVKQADQRNVDELNNQISSFKTETTASVKNLGDRVTTEVNSVTTKINDIKVGGRNYLRNSDKSTSGWAQDLGTMPNEVLNSLAGKTITVSADVEWSNFVSASGVQNRLGFEIFAHRSDGKDQWFGTWAWPTTSNGKKRISTTFDVPAGLTYTVSNNGQNGYVSIKGTGTVSHAKIEIGNKPTDWSPAPEDTAEAINSLNTKWDVANGQIQGKVTATDVNNILNGKGYATQSWAQTMFTMKSDAITLQAVRDNITNGIQNQVNGINNKIDTQTLDSADINNMKTQGHYFVKNLANSPISGWVYVDVTGNNNDRLKQDVYQDSGYEHRSRRWFDNSWTEWTTDVNNKNVISQINITPESLKISSNKIEIDGNTSIHGTLSVPEVRLQGKSGMIGLDGNSGIIISSADTLFQTRVTRYGMDFLTSTNGQKEIMGGITTGANVNNSNLNGISIVLDTQQKLGAPYGGDFFSIGKTTSIKNNDDRIWSKAMDYDASGQLHQGGFMWYEKSYLTGEGQNIYVGGVRGNGDSAYDPIFIGTRQWNKAAQTDVPQPLITLGYGGTINSDSGLGLVWNQMKPYGDWDITDVNDIWYDGQHFRFTWVSHPSMMGNMRVPSFVKVDPNGGISSGICFAPGSVWSIGATGSGNITRNLLF